MASYRGGRMDIEELTQKIDAKQLKEEAKKRGIKTACVKKIDIAVSLSRSLYKEAFSGSGSI
ncbi:MAG: hypothetical protein GH156_02750 [Dehalococcoidia bacterium]|nr:hypothetical protein [Dehalococcoidia bacterium]